MYPDKNVFILFICLLLQCWMPVAHSASEINLTRSKLVQLTLHLEVADKQLQYDFTRIAIIEMIQSFEQELLRSQHNLPRTIKGRAKVRRWQFATQTYLESLDHYLFQMDSGVPLEFMISKQNKILILIGQQPVIISGPNSGGDKQIEHKIVDVFCEQNDCREYFNRPVIQDINSLHKKNVPYKKIYSSVTGTWSIDSKLNADFISSNGLTFKFLSIAERAKKEAWALQISHELLLLRV